MDRTPPRFAILLAELCETVSRLGLAIRIVWRLNEGGDDVRASKI
jgi:hypothetical protein